MQVAWCARYRKVSLTVRRGTNEKIEYQTIANCLDNAAVRSVELYLLLLGLYCHLEQGKTYPALSFAVHHASMSLSILPVSERPFPIPALMGHQRSCPQMAAFS